MKKEVKYGLLVSGTILALVLVPNVVSAYIGKAKDHKTNAEDLEKAFISKYGDKGFEDSFFAYIKSKSQGQGKEVENVAESIIKNWDRRILYTPTHWAYFSNWINGFKYDSVLPL